MILVLGGTTEGRIAVRTLDEAGKTYYYSTKSGVQEVTGRYAVCLSGVLDEQRMAEFCRVRDIRLLVDAAHPFAVELHRTVAKVAKALQIPSVRLERVFAPHDNSVVWCRDYDDVVCRLNSEGRLRELAQNGVQTIEKLSAYWKAPGHRCFFRILRRDESRHIALRSGFPEADLVYYDNDVQTGRLMTQILPDAIVTKESGSTGGYEEKVRAAHELGIPVYVVERPTLPDYVETVTGPHGLRKAVERLVPSFYPLRSGFTTGSCATAAAKAALEALLTGEKIKDCIITLPDGESVSLPVERVEVAPDGQSATAYVIKDAGDDPDVTHGHEIGATVAFSSCPGIHFLQGEGVGRVTLPGLGIPVGEPAINRVPRSMMTRELTTRYPGEGLDVTIFVPEGRALALRTFNPKLGIVDGISILGTLGIVRPFSTEAFIDSIRREIEVCLAVGSSRLVINSGAKSERFVKRLYPELPPQAFVHFGNFIGETIKLAAALGVREVTMGIMLGKAVKLAEGNLDTHSKKTLMNKAFLKSVAQACGCSPQADIVIENLTLARELWHGLSSDDADLFFPQLLRLCRQHTAPLLPDGRLEILLIDEDGDIRYRI